MPRNRLLPSGGTPPPGVIPALAVQVAIVGHEMAHQVRRVSRHHGYDRLLSPVGCAAGALFTQELQSVFDG